MSSYRIKIMTTKPDITDEEVRRSMNFDQVLKGVAEYNLSRARRVRRITTGCVAFILLLIALTATFYFRSPDQQEQKTTGLLPVRQDTIQHIDPILPKKSFPLITEAPKTKAVPEKSKKKHPTVPVSEMKVNTPYVNAEPVTGFPALYDFINSELRYPAAALADSIQGTVSVSLTINEQGHAENFRIANSLCESCDKEALRVVTLMPLWKPATLDGKAVKSNITIPVDFTIHRN